VSCKLKFGNEAAFVAQRQFISMPAHAHTKIALCASTFYIRRSHRFYTEQEKTDLRILVCFGRIAYMYRKKYHTDSVLQPCNLQKTAMANFL